MSKNTVVAEVVRSIRRARKSAEENLGRAVKFQQLVQTHLNLLPDLNDLVEENRISLYANSWSPNELRFHVTVPWDMKLADEVCLRFTRLGWTLVEDKDWISDFKERDLKFTHPELVKPETTGFSFTVVVSINAEKDGSKCRLEVAEKKIIETEKIIWRVVCEDMQNV